MSAVDGTDFEFAPESRVEAHARALERIESERETAPLRVDPVDVDIAVAMRRSLAAQEVRSGRLLERLEDLAASIETVGLARASAVVPAELAALFDLARAVERDGAETRRLFQDWTYSVSGHVALHTCALEDRVRAEQARLAAKRVRGIVAAAAVLVAAVVGLSAASVVGARSAAREAYAEEGPGSMRILKIYQKDAESTPQAVPGSMPGGAPAHGPSSAPDRAPAMKTADAPGPRISGSLVVEPGERAQGTDLVPSLVQPVN